uniref:Uncharacterized protein n=1 Tax=Pyrodinium bahamense TaxID=73915 RepID=A0A6T9B0R6_9DINO
MERLVRAACPGPYGGFTGVLCGEEALGEDVLVEVLSEPLFTVDCSAATCHPATELAEEEAELPQGSLPTASLVAAEGGQRSCGWAPSRPPFSRTTGLLRCSSAAAGVLAVPTPARGVQLALAAVARRAPPPAPEPAPAVDRRDLGQAGSRDSRVVVPINGASSGGSSLTSPSRGVAQAAEGAWTARLCPPIPAAASQEPPPDCPLRLCLLLRARLAREGQHVYVWRDGARVLVLASSIRSSCELEEPTEAQVSSSPSGARARTASYDDPVPSERWERI